MRYRFAREGVLTVVGKHFFDPESIKWDPSRLIPVVWDNNFGNADAVMGTASEIRREDDGWLTAEIAWNQKGIEVEPFINKDAFLTIHLNKLVETDNSSLEGGRRVIHEGNLLNIYAAPNEKDPWTEAVEQVLCPECAAGKEPNCTGEMVHPVTDQIVTCATAR